MSGYQWPACDIATLRTEYGKTATQQLAFQLGRSPKAVRSMARRLMLGFSKEWKPEEDALLKELYRNSMVSVSTISEKLGRSFQAIHMRAMKLQITGFRKRKLSEGDERLNSKGLLLRKIASTGNLWKDYKRVDVLDWEAVHGPVPQGMVLARVNPFLPRTPNNLALFTKTEMSARIQNRNHPPEMRELLALRREIMKLLEKPSTTSATG